jgi:hypothetical protein
MSQIKEITQTSIQINPSLRSDVSQLLQNLLTKLQALENHEEYLEKLNQQSGSSAENDSTDKSSNGFHPQISVHSNHSHKSNSSNSSLIVSTLSHQTDISETCSSPLLLAHQLTHIELERLSFIGPEEFVQAFTKEHPSIESSFKDLKKTRNLESYVAWFNRLSYHVATDVIKVSTRSDANHFIFRKCFFVRDSSLNVCFPSLAIFSTRKRSRGRELLNFGLKQHASHST